MDSVRYPDTRIYTIWWPGIRCETVAIAQDTCAARRRMGLGSGQVRHHLLRCTPQRREIVFKECLMYAHARRWMTFLLPLFTSITRLQQREELTPK